MRILHMADLHFRQEWYKWASQCPESFDVLVIAGDLLNMFPGASIPLPEQARVVRDWLKTLTKPAVVCTGNHDLWVANPLSLTDKLAEGRWLQSCKSERLVVDGQTASIQGEVFAAVKWGGTHWPDGAGIVVSHAPPSETPVSTNDEGVDWGDFEIAVRVNEQRPRYVLSGHVHQPMDWVTLAGKSYCFNPGCDWMASTPNHIIIDTTAKIACWQSEQKGRVTRTLTE